MELACKDKITSNELQKLYGRHIANGSIFCTECELQIIYIRRSNVIIRKYGKLVSDNIHSIIK